MIIRLSIFLIVALLYACSNRVRVTDISSSGIEIQLNSKTPKTLITTWYRHPELETKKDSMVYLAEAIDTIPLRGKEGMQFFEDGKFVKIEIGPDDKPIKHQGVWVFDSKYKIVDINFEKLEVGLIPMTKEEKKPYSFKIESLTKNVMTIRIHCME
ncbi:MAG: hypothetical protein SFY32_05795 [Bacteroidota bacterium]|nr:hypothetical protein [Bacteroidota bacterium]